MESSYNYWEKYYNTNRNPSKCSNFAKFVLPFLSPGKQLTELGCGNAKDSIFFAQNGIKVLGIDQCTEELAFLNKQFKDEYDISFLSKDMTRLDDLPKSDYVYSRFTLHAIDLEGEKRVLQWVAENLLVNGLFFIEVRSVNDELYGQGKALPDNAYFSDHYRRFLVINELIKRLKKVDLKILYKLESKGLAPYKDEDPSVIRIIAIK